MSHPLVGHAACAVCVMSLCVAVAKIGVLRTCVRRCARCQGSEQCGECAADTPGTVSASADGPKHGGVVSKKLVLVCICSCAVFRMAGTCLVIITCGCVQLVAY
jgi:hypothetical protein